VPFFLYPDPELSKQGVFISKSLSARLVKNLYARWGDEPFSVCSEKSNFKRSMEWASENTDYFKKGSDGVLRAVIVSHGHFLKKCLALTLR
jgi:hypothetical protein